MKIENVIIVDYGIGNLYSVQRALEFCGATQVRIASCANEILCADKLVIPGVGAFADGMKGLKERNLISPIMKHASNGKAVLGICLGMQLLATVSEEFGLHEGLNLIPGSVKSIPKSTDGILNRRIPFIGWESLTENFPGAWENSIFHGLDNKESFYLVHSYEFIPENNEATLANYDYFGYKVTAAVRKDNIYGVQFHPEKSSKSGLKLLKNFLNL